MAPQETAPPRLPRPPGAGSSRVPLSFEPWLKACSGYPAGPPCASRRPPGVARGGGAGRVAEGPPADARGGPPSAREPLEGWLERAQAGDPAAFGALSEALGPRLLRYVLAPLCGDVHAASDVVQESLLAAWHARERFRGVDHLRAWLFRVSRNQAVSWIRRRGPGGEAPLELEGAAVQEEARRRLRPDRGEEAESDLAPGALDGLLAGLPPRYRAPIRLHYFLGHDTRETAQLLGISTNALKMRLHRARNLLRRRLADLEPAAAPGLVERARELVPPRPRAPGGASRRRRRARAPRPRRTPPGAAPRAARGRRRKAGGPDPPP